MYFSYGETELNYLRKKDKRLCAVIDRIGHVNRAVDSDLFSAVVHHMIGQQISTRAQATIWQRALDSAWHSQRGNGAGRGYSKAASPRHDLPQGGIYHRLRRKGAFRCV